MTVCATDDARELACRDGHAASHLKLISIFVIFFTSIIGISAPVLLSKLFQGKPVYDKSTLLIKCFAAGVILSTSLVHVLPDAFAALADCQVASRHPWKDYPFSGLITLFGALLALVVDLTATSHVNLHNHGHQSKEYKPIDGSRGKKLGLGLGEGGDKGKLKEYTVIEEQEGKNAGAKLEDGLVVVEGNGGVEDEFSVSEDLMKLKQRLVSQVLEIGIIFHSVIIGVTMGMSQNKCTIKPLVAALAFHQIFEGMGLGGCIAQAGFGFGTVAHMCFMFSVTTPVGIILGMIVFAVTGYDDNSPNALILEGLLGSLSSGILIYMALVDLISADFFHNMMMNCEPWMKKACFIALVLGSSAMSVLALWA